MSRTVAASAAQVLVSLAAVDVELSDDEVARLEEPYVPHPLAGFV